MSSSYLREKGKFISKSSIHNILKNNLRLKYLKTTYKNNFLQTNEGIILCLIFIKIILRAIKLGFELIYLDESKVELYNSHYKCWRQKNETIYFSNNKKQKLNILMAITKDKVYHYQLNSENTTSKNYLVFLESLYEKYSKESAKKFIIILDNLKLHKTKDVISFCSEKKINLIFNIPYQSPFNTIELCFRSIKKIVYSNLYESLNELQKDIETIINDNKFKKTLLFNFKETLKEYLAFSDKYKDYNFNNIFIWYFT